MSDLVRLDLACGQQKQAGFIGVDIVDLPGVDVVHDLETYPWPFPDNYTDYVFISHFIEHIKDLISFFNELYRIMKPGTSATILAPYATSVRAWQDPTHIRPISEGTFLYYNKEWREKVHVDHYPITCDFDFSYGYSYYDEWVNRSEEAKRFAVQHYNNVVSDIQVVLTKR